MHRPVYCNSPIFLFCTLLDPGCPFAPGAFTVTTDTPAMTPLVFFLALFIALACTHPSTPEEFLQAEVANFPLLRGVNLGGWLVLEPFLTPALFTNGAVDQWTFDQKAGSEESLRKHWDTYCTEADIKKLASYGVNACVIHSIIFHVGNEILHLSTSGFALASASGLTTTLALRIILALTLI